MSSSSDVKEDGSCSCGAIKFTISGPYLGVFLCHCRACVRSKGCGPNLILGVGGSGDKIITYKDENKKAKEIKSVYEPMIQGFCDECGSHIYQYPDGASFFGIYPGVFEYEDGKNTSQHAVDEKMKVENANCILPKRLQPQMHINYENRLCDYEDKLPKFRNAPKAFGGDDVVVNNDGSDIKKDADEEKKDVGSPSKLRKEVEASRTTEDGDVKKEEEKKDADEKKEPFKALVMDDVLFTKKWRDESLVSLKDKVVAITGTTSGTGLVVAREAARLGAHVLLLNRPSTRAEAAVKLVAAAVEADDWKKDDKTAASETALKQVTHIDCDMLKLESVEAAAKRVVEIANPLGGLDVLVCNAGITHSQKDDTADGYDKVIQVNYLSHIALLNNVFDALKKAGSDPKRAEFGPRVVFHTSAGICACKDRTIPAAAFQKGDSRKWPADEELPLDWNGQGRYYLSKTAMLAAAAGLHEKWKDTKIRSLSAHPGMAATNVFQTNCPENLEVANQYLGMIGQSDADGAMPVLLCMASKDAQSGDFYGPDGSAELEMGTQMKGTPEKITPSEWVKALIKQGSDVLENTFKGLGIESNIK